MIKILFICLGNICRSPMAEFVLKDMVKKKGIQNDFYIDSAATSNEEVGNGMHYGTIEKLKKSQIEYTDHKARRITPNDYLKFDYIICMEERNIRDILNIIGQDNEHKVYKLLDFTNKPRDIADPWYTGNFEITYKEVVEGCKAFLKKLSGNIKKQKRKVD